MMKALVVAAMLLAAVAGCKSARDAHPSGDTYPQHERWWR
jgi:hypothetical protein